jgi:3-keto-5-aminohexanoate cleavage enzyme
MGKLIITAAIQGAELTQEEMPHLPITPVQAAQEAKRAWEEGASIIHLHVRDKFKKSSQRADDFRANIEAINTIGCKAIIQVSTGGAVGMSAEERMDPLTLRPEYSTLNTGSINFGRDVFINSVPMMEKLASVMKEYGVKPEFEVYEEGHVDNALALVKKGLVTGQLNFDFVLGVPGAMTASVKNMLLLIEAIPKDANWTVAGVGKNQLLLNGASIFMGGHVRTGFEDNIYYSKGVLAKSNAELVARVVRVAKEAGRAIASPEEARKILGITGKS